MAMRGIDIKKSIKFEATPYSSAPKQKKGPKQKADSTQTTFQLNKSYGQHLLKNPVILDSIVEKANLKSTDIVIEIGPGTGNLTVRMLPLVKKVIAFEVDERMVAELQKRVAGTELKNKLEIIHGDVLKQKLPYFDVVVSNTPYQISSPLTFKLLEHRPLFREAFLMFQREFAQRLVAEPNNEQYCRLSVNAQLLSKVSHVMKVGKNNFRPPPKVESDIVKLKPHNPPPPVNFSEWDGMVKLCFGRKNKTLRAIFKKDSAIKAITESYKTWCAVNEVPLPDPLPDMKEKVMEILEKAEFSQTRSSKMDINDFLKLLVMFNEEGIHFSS